MSWSGNVQIHQVPGTGYPGTPKIDAYVSFGDVWRDGNTVYCDVSASLNAMGKYSYFGYYIKVFAQIDNGSLVQLFYKPNSPSRWNSGVYSGSGRVSASNTSSNATLSIWFESNCGSECWGAHSSYKMFSTNVSAPAMDPPNLSLYNAGYNANYLSWNAYTDVACDEWKYSLDGGPEYYYSSNEWSSPGTLGVSSDIHRVYVTAHRKNGKWGTSNTVWWDCRIPNIVNPGISVTGVNSGVLYFYTDYSVNYYINNVYLGTGSGNLSANVSLQNNTNTGYELKITRTENTDIINTYMVYADTTYANIILQTTVVGTTIQYSAYSNTNCRDWYMELSWTDTGGVLHKDIIRPQTAVSTFWNGTLLDKDIDTVYTLQVFATKSSNNVFSSSNTISAQPEACLHLFDNENNPKIAVPYIYIEGRGWTKASPHIWKNTDNKWHVCI